jgi:hypothetical protein
MQKIYAKLYSMYRRLLQSINIKNTDYTIGIFYLTAFRKSKKMPRKRIISWVSLCHEYVHLDQSTQILLQTMSQY